MNFNPFPTLSSERLILRAPTKSDGPEILFLRSDAKVNQFIKRQAPKDIREAEAFIEKVTKGAKENKTVYWCISLQGENKMIGSICLWNFSEDLKTGEVGYDLNPEYHSKGIMSEALKTVIKYGFEDLSLDAITAYTHGQNEASTKLLIKHNFAHQEGMIDEGNLDNIIFELKS